jgi:hypothetical protein
VGGNRNAWLTFSKQEVLAGAAVAERRFQSQDPALAKYLVRLRCRYAADTAQLAMVPMLSQVGLVGTDTAGFYRAELFYIVDEYLLEQGRFCALDKRTNRSFPWVRLVCIKGPEDNFRVLRGPNGVSPYSTPH